MYVNVCKCMYVCMYMYMYVYVCICMYMYVCVCMCMYVYVYVCICMYMYVYVCAYGSKTVLIKRTFLLMGCGGLCWGGCVNVLSSAYSTYFYAPEISGMLAALHVATLPRSLECLPDYMLLRCRDLWNACHVICCYAAEISGMLAIQALLMLRVRAANNSSQKLWVPGTKISFYMPKCGNGASSISTRTCSRRLQTCCTSSNEKKKCLILSDRNEAKNCILLW